jgi:opacity protein-like surface antigen
MNKEKISKGRKFTVLIFVLVMLAFSGNLLAQEKNSKEISLSAVGAANFGEFRFIEGPMITIGYNTTKGIGFEAGGIIVFGETVGALLSGNIVVSPFNIRKIVPYATGGLWTSHSFAGVGWNAGGGIKLLLSDKLAIRAEYRRWSSFEEFSFGVNTFSGGLSYIF